MTKLDNNEHISDLIIPNGNLIETITYLNELKGLYKKGMMLNAKRKDTLQSVSFLFRQPLTHLASRRAPMAINTAPIIPTMILPPPKYD